MAGGMGGLALEKLHVAHQVLWVLHKPMSLPFLHSGQMHRVPHCHWGRLQ